MVGYFLLIGFGGDEMDLADKSLRRADKLCDNTKIGSLVPDDKIALKKAKLILKAPHQPQPSH